MQLSFTVCVAPFSHAPFLLIFSQWEISKPTPPISETFLNAHMHSRGTIVLSEAVHHSLPTIFRYSCQTSLSPHSFLGSLSPHLFFLPNTIYLSSQILSPSHIFSLRLSLLLLPRSHHKLAPPHRLRVQKPRADRLDELFWRRHSPRLHVLDSHDEDIACRQACAAEDACRDVVRHDWRGW